MKFTGSVAWLFSAAPLLLVYGCERPPNPQMDPVQVTKESLQKRIGELANRDERTDLEQYTLTAFERAISTLDELGSSSLNQPIPVAAVFRLRDNALDSLPTLQLIWLEQADIATGIYIMNSEGEIDEFKNALKWDGTEDWAGVLRSASIPLILEVAPSHEWDHLRSKHGPLQVDSSHGASSVKVGLLTQSGRTSAVDAFHE